VSCLACCTTLGERSAGCARAEVGEGITRGGSSRRTPTHTTLSGLAKRATSLVQALWVYSCEDRPFASHNPLWPGLSSSERPTLERALCLWSPTPPFLLHR
jgi:hypothetical protein